MKWRGRRSSDNVRKVGSGGGVRTAGALGGGGLIIMLVISLLMGGNPLDVLLNNPQVSPGQSQTTEYESRSAEEKEIEDFLAVVLADTEDVWTEIFADHGAQYREPSLVLYQDNVNSGCGYASSNMGPFYCGADETVYIDVAFAKDLRTTFDAAGDFPFAYVLAHEVGHHVQKLTGQLEEVQSMRNQSNYNNEMVKLELQADYYAGVVAHYLQNKGYLDKGDVQEGMAAASGVGDDRIMEMQGGQANPDNFQHGSSEQRQRWFLRGFEYGDIENGNTFSVRDAQDL